MTDWLCTGPLGFRIRLPVTSATRFWREQECVRRGGCSERPAGRLRPSSGPLSCGRAGLGPQGQERVAERLSPKGHFKRERQQPPRTAWRGPVWPGFSVLIPMAVCRPRDARSCCGQAAGGHARERSPEEQGRPSLVGPPLAGRSASGDGLSHNGLFRGHRCHGSRLRAPARAASAGRSDRLFAGGLTLPRTGLQETTPQPPSPAPGSTGDEPGVGSEHVPSSSAFTD